MTPEQHILFNRWVVVPISALRAIPNGDGAFAALTMTFGLYERFLDSKIHKRGDSANPQLRYAEASTDFGGEVTPSDFQNFWEMYRVGMQHFFHPKSFTKSKDQTSWGWDISEHETYKAYPIIEERSPKHFIIKINPWAFTEHVLKRWYEFPDLMDELSATKLGEIRQISPATISPTNSTYNWNTPTPESSSITPPRECSTRKYPG